MGFQKDRFELLGLVIYLEMAGVKQFGVIFVVGVVRIVGVIRLYQPVDDGFKLASVVGGCCHVEVEVEVEGFLLGSRDDSASFYGDSEVKEDY